MDRLARKGNMPADATRPIKLAYGEAASRMFIMNVIGKCWVHPTIVNHATNQQAAAARHAPFLNAPHLGQGRGSQATMHMDRRLFLALLFHPVTVPRLLYMMQLSRHSNC